ncbi:MAG: hypothetical protein ABI781_21180 [Burkholderiales bacterium]
MNSKIVRKTTATPAPKSPKPAAPARKDAAPAKTAKAAPAAELAVAASKTKHKLVRDSFTIPKTEYAVLEALKARAAKLARPVKKSELLRAGIAALNGMSDKAFLATMNGVPSLKTGRPSGVKAAAPATQSAK